MFFNVPVMSSRRKEGEVRGWECAEWIGGHCLDLQLELLLVTPPPRSRSRIACPRRAMPQGRYGLVDDAS